MYKFSKMSKLTDGVIGEPGNQPEKVDKDRINVHVNKHIDLVQDVVYAYIYDVKEP